MSNTTAENEAKPPTQSEIMVKKAAFASFLGNFIEWFDYASYSYLAVIIAKVFFGSDDPTLDLLSTFAVFALSFILRPIGAVVWGNLGDKKGRRWALSMSILLMSGATFLIGCLPPAASIGMLAPLGLLVLRMVQGFSASGEYAGAATFIAEYAPIEKRGMLVSLVPASTATGLLLGSLSVTGMHAVLSSEQIETWGWRIPFLLAGPLGLITRYIRVHLEDSPVYVEMLAETTRPNEIVKQPIREIFTHYRRPLLISFGVASLNAVGFYVVLTYLPTYMIEVVKMPKDESYLATTITLVVYVFAIFAAGHISDIFGRKKMLIAACIGFIVLSLPAFILLGTSGFWMIVLIETVLCIVLTINDGTLATYLTETFPTNVRYSGFALSFNLANAIFGGTAPFICTWLIKVTDSSLAPAGYLIVVSSAALVAMIMSHEHSGTDLRDVPESDHAIQDRADVI
ncbi:MAG: MFS transporter [Actinomycetaceae bacterium]|nr:MFS transporter [Actinomycetaceae bacterium]